MPKALVYGGSGQLGEAVVQKFRQSGWEVVSVDFRVSEHASASITLTGAPVADEVAAVASQVASFAPFNALINVAGGWAGGSIKVSRSITSNRATSISIDCKVVVDICCDTL
jgi:NAD(P)-dependent dehydrogenase (short-subunit alcohol dehydrogenase family)